MNTGMQNLWRAVLILLSRAAVAEGASSGALICDAVNVCNFEVYNYSCPPGMELVAPPVHSGNYSFRAGDGNAADDPVEYTPGLSMDLTLRVLGPDWKYIGLLLCAL